MHDVGFCLMHCILTHELVNKRYSNRYLINVNYNTWNSLSKDRISDKQQEIGKQFDYTCVRVFKIHGELVKLLRISSWYFINNWALSVSLAAICCTGRVIRPMSLHWPSGKIHVRGNIIHMSFQMFLGLLEIIQWIKNSLFLIAVAALHT